MECKLAERLRNVALALMARELRMLVHRRSLVTTNAAKGVPDVQTLTSLRRETDDARKAMRHHIANCGSCQTLNKGAGFELIPGLNVESLENRSSNSLSRRSRQALMIQAVLGIGVIKLALMTRNRNHWLEAAC
jgi:Tfp pilus assembly protein PilW